MRKDILFWILTSLAGSIIYMICVIVEITSIPGFEFSFVDIIVLEMILLLVSLLASSPLLLISYLMIRVFNKTSLFYRNTIFFVIVMLATMIHWYMTVEMKDAILFLSSYGISGIVFLNLIFWKNKLNPKVT